MVLRPFETANNGLFAAPHMCRDETHGALCLVTVAINKETYECLFFSRFPSSLGPSSRHSSFFIDMCCLLLKRNRILFKLESRQCCGCPPPVRLGLGKKESTERMLLTFQLNELQGYTQSQRWFGRSVMKSAGMQQGMM